MTIDLNKIPTGAPEGLDKDQLKADGKYYEKAIDDLQEIMFAQEKHSLLIVFQGLDAAGKDGSTKKVLGRLNPQGVKVKSFKKPTDEEEKMCRNDDQIPQSE